MGERIWSLTEKQLSANVRFLVTAELAKLAGEVRELQDRVADSGASPDLNMLVALDRAQEMRRLCADADRYVAGDGRT